MLFCDAIFFKQLISPVSWFCSTRFMVFADKDATNSCQWSDTIIDAKLRDITLSCESSESWNRSIPFLQDSLPLQFLSSKMVVLAYYFFTPFWNYGTTATRPRQLVPWQLIPSWNYNIDHVWFLSSTAQVIHLSKVFITALWGLRESNPGRQLSKRRLYPFQHCRSGSIYYSYHWFFFLQT